MRDARDLRPCASGCTGEGDRMGAEQIEHPGDVTGGWLRSRGRTCSAEIEVRSKGFTEITVRMQRQPPQVR